MFRITIALLLLSLPGPPSLALDRYQANFSDDLSTIQVQACFGDQAPGRLELREKAVQAIDWVRHGTQNLRIDRTSNSIDLSALGMNDCAHWQVDLGKALEADDYRWAFTAGDAVLMHPGVWLWTPSPQRPLEVAVEVAAGQSFSSPWPREKGLHRPVLTPDWWSSRVVVGQYEQLTMTLPGGQLELALAGDFSAQQRDTMVAFVRQAALSTVSVIGRFPRPSAQIVVVPIGQRSEPVPWAHVIRGGGPAIEFFVDPNRPLQEFQADWTATHEFSHLLLPYVAYNDRWLSEGLASWFQQVLRARDGRLGETEAWQRLHAGFERGRKATRRETLVEATRAGHSRTMRIYWGGAAFWLKADVLLRQRSQGNWSLDLALAAFNQCCVEAGQSWRANELIKSLDEITGLGVFGDVYRSDVQAEQFAELSDLYRQLGIELSGQKVKLNANAPWAVLRQDIMNGTSASTPP